MFAVASHLLQLKSSIHIIISNTLNFSRIVRNLAKNNIFPDIILLYNFKFALFCILLTICRMLSIYCDKRIVASILSCCATMRHKKCSKRDNKTREIQFEVNKTLLYYRGGVSTVQIFPGGVVERLRNATKMTVGFFFFF